MGIRLFVEVLDHAPDALTWRERWALAVLAETANDETRECWPGIEDDPTLAQRMRIPGRSSRYAVIKSLREKGALEGVSAGHRGRRAVYRIPVLRPGKGPQSADAIDVEGSAELGPNATESVQEPRTLPARKGPQNPDPIDVEGSGNEFERVPEPIRKGPSSTDPFPSVPSDSSRELASAPAREGEIGYGIPDAARPLVDQLTAAGVIVRWPFKGDQWFPVLSVIEKSGIAAMVDHAVKANARADVQSANYFLRGWRELPPQPAPGTPRPPLRAVPAGGWQPYTNPTDHSVYENGWGS